MQALGRIGPNAITRVAEALLQQRGPQVTSRVFWRAGLSGHLASPPQDMVDEGDARRLHASLRLEIGSDAAARVSRAAGIATAEYLLANRIPKPVQRVLKLLPPALACRVLLHAIRRHAWTFAGSGSFEARAGSPTVLTIRDNPLCRGMVSTEPACDYYAATFEHLFRALVSARTQVTETQCEAKGDSACRFELRW
jgi:divinyl protochlorophyllide a 8-vinyl-reductase